MIKIFFEKDYSLFEIIIIFLIAGLCNISWWFALLIIPGIIIKNKGEKYLKK